MKSRMTSSSSLPSRTRSRSPRPYRHEFCCSSRVVGGAYIAQMPSRDCYSACRALVRRRCTVLGMEVAELAHLRRARDLLDRGPARPLDVPVMARAALMSPSLFSRRFREAYGDTPYGYLQARRVERAMALLRRGEESVTDVCLAVGFTSLGSFS